MSTATCWFCHEPIKGRVYVLVVGHVAPNGKNKLPKEREVKACKTCHSYVDDDYEVSDG